MTSTASSDNVDRKTMITNTNDSNSCIFCTVIVNNSSPSLPRIENGRMIVINLPDDHFLEDHLKVIFILRKLLDIQEDVCYQYLAGNNGIRIRTRGFLSAQSARKPFKNAMHSIMEFLRYTRSSRSTNGS